MPLSPQIASLRRRFKLARREAAVAGRRFPLVCPRDPDGLIDEVSFDDHDRLPYWAEIWPSSAILAEQIAGRRGDGRRLLELGCGVGLVSIVAAQAGFEVLATDYYAEALEFAAYNAARHGARVATRLVDWRRLPDDLDTFDLVVASDVLYERANAELIAGVYNRCLGPGGLGLLTDPGRRVAGPFREVCAQHGLHAELAARFPVVDGATPKTIDLFEIRRK